jgi:PAS domain S-box-containing protein
VVNPAVECGDCPLVGTYAGNARLIARLEYGGRIYGFLTVTFPVEMAQDEEERLLFDEVSGDIAFALHSMELEEERKQAEERIRNLMESTPIGILISASEGDVPEINKAILQIFGYNSKEEFTKVPASAHYYDPKDRERFLELHKRGLVKDFEVRFKRKDGSVFWGSVTSATQTTEAGTTEIINVLEDITERKKAEEDRKKLESQLQQSQKLEAIGSLAGGVAHDFNNILTVIIGNAELLSISLGKDNPLQGRVEEISKGGERAASLTRQLLAFSRRQVLQPQVLDHARDAMPTGGKLTIETANVDLDESYAGKHIAVKPGPYVMMAISDTGIGMDEETRSNIFEPFFTTKEKGRGTGLGLSTVYGIVKQSGGNIWVYSEPEKGTTFKIYLPRVEKVAETAEKVKATAESLTGSETIMVVEDDKMVRDMAKSILRKYGYSILDAPDGEEAIRVSEQHEGPIHLMLTDVVMPGISGRVLAERLAVQRPKMKVLYMSGYTDNAIVRHGVLDKEVIFPG